MDSTLRMPIDLQQLPPMRALRERHGPARAVFVWWTVWQELGYLMQDGHPPGQVSAEALPAFLQAFLPEFDGAAAQQLWERDLVQQGERDPRLFRKHGEGFLCLRFAALHGDVPGPRSREQKGGDLRAFDRRMAAAGPASFQQSLALPAEFLRTAAGEPLPAEMGQRATRLVIACDNALFKPERPGYGWTEGLIQSAVRVLDKFTVEQTDQVCRLIAAHRNHPALSGLTTERLLDQFTDVAGKISN